jgi:peroxiredoxin
VKLAIVALLLSGVAVGVSLMATRRPEGVRSNMPNLATGPRHPVSRPMQSTSDSLAGAVAADQTVRDREGRPVRLSEAWEAKPTVLVFTKDGCPCSIEAQPHFNRLAKRYQGRAAFLGLIDSGPVPAGKYQDDFSVPYPVLSVSDPNVFRAYRAERSVYVTLVHPGGKIARQWPGYSRQMLRGLDAEIARSLGAEPSGEAFEGAPEEATSGCLLFGEVGE